MLIQSSVNLMMRDRIKKSKIRIQEYNNLDKTIYLLKQRFEIKVTSIN